MNRLSLGVALLLVVQALVIAGPAEPGPPEAGRPGEVVSQLQSVRVVNDTDDDLLHVFVRSIPRDPWGVDITGSGISLAAGRAADYLVHAEGSVASLELVAIQADYDVYARSAIKLQRGRVTELRISGRDFVGERLAPSRIGTVTMQNSFNDAIWYLFMRPSAARAYGVELLGQRGTLASGDTISFDVLDFTQSLLIDLNAYSRDGEVMDAVQFAGDFVLLRSYDY